MLERVLRDTARERTQLIREFIEWCRGCIELARVAWRTSVARAVALVRMPVDYVANNWVQYAKLLLVAIATAALLWAVSLSIAYAVCLGATPTFIARYPVHFDFTPLGGPKPPVANVTLLNTRAIVDGQHYAFDLELVLPETERNIAVGTLTVQLRVVTRSGADAVVSQYSVRH
jgi:hypothetical protein